jgi:hypothetical protein
MSSHRLITIILITVMSWSCSKSKNGGQPAPPSPPVTTLPKLTQPVSVQTGLNFVVATGSISDSGNKVIIRKGFCWSKNPDPTIDSFYLNSNGPSSISFTDSIKGLTYNTRYYLRAFAVNSNGTAYSAVTTFQTRQSIYTRGQNFGGGYIFYIDSTGEHGFIATDPIGGKRWAYWPYHNILIGTTRFEIGTGKANTQAIINAGNNDPASAAMACKNLVVNGYNDWFLPSTGELYLVRQNKDVLPFFGYFYNGNLYWSSSEVSNYQAYITPINATASFGYDSKDMGWGVVPIRSF